MKQIAIVLIPLLALFQSDGSHAQLARQEFHSIPSASMSPADFLTGKQGIPVMLAAELRLPKIGPGKQPAVVLLHGSSGPGGPGGIYDAWTKVLNEGGFATFAIDSFAGRGIVNLPGDVGKLSPITRMVDVYSALKVLANHPMIDSSRIAVMGFSHGSPAAFYSNLVRFRKAHGHNDVQFAAHISVYGFCTVRYRDDETLAKPVLVLHGTADDLLPIEPCREYAARLSKAGNNVRLMEYPDAHHAFDMPQFSVALKLPEAPTPRRCRLTEGDNGLILNADTKQPFTPSDPCLEKGVTVAYQEAAAKKSHEDVKAFLKEALQLK